MTFHKQGSLRGKTAAHEAAHLLGLIDEYIRRDDGTTYLSPEKKGQLMADRQGAVIEAYISAIIRNDFHPTERRWINQVIKR